MTERPIGATFDDPIYGKLQVVESDNCFECVYKHKIFCTKPRQLAGFCIAQDREDGRNVLFKLADND